MKRPASTSRPALAHQHSHLPRLLRDNYHGLSFIHWTMTADDRATGWLTERFHDACREVLTHTLFQHELFCLVYCVMPDHFHLLWPGISPASDQMDAVRFFRRHLNRLLEAADKNPRSGARGYRLQRQAYDHVLRETERKPDAFEKIAQYVLENPVRAGLTKTTTEYPFSGCVIPGYPELEIRKPDYWERFWRIYAAVVTKSAPPPCAQSENL